MDHAVLAERSDGALALAVMASLPTGGTPPQAWPCSFHDVRNQRFFLKIDTRGLSRTIDRGHNRRPTSPQNRAFSVQHKLTT